MKASNLRSSLARSLGLSKKSATVDFTKCTCDCGYAPRSRVLGAGRYGYVVITGPWGENLQSSILATCSQQKAFHSLFTDELTRFSEVRLAKKVSNEKTLNKKLAVKVIDMVHKAHVKREIIALQALQHENIIKLVHFHVKDKKAYIFLELAEGSTLEAQIADNGPTDEFQARTWFRQLAGALAHVHKKGFSHKDIKENNIVLKNGNVKLIDFGLCEKSSTKCKRFYRGTMLYLAPEILLEKKFDTQKTDVWALGVVLFRTLTGQYPYPAGSLPELLRKIAMGRLVFPDNVILSKRAKDLMSQMLCQDPAQRPTMIQVLEHDWLAETEK